jgi:regulator of sirC expression with transglutaminase-like and TPR domain
MKSRNGKIARLPHDVREELNQRLERCEQSPALLAWLNALPVVQEFVQKEFGGEPVSKHNLSQWRLGGFQEWLTRRDFFADARNADDFVAERKDGRKQALADQVATVLAVRYAGLLIQWNGECTKDFEARARILNGLTRGVAELQREAHKAPHPVPSQCVAVSRSDKMVKPPLTGNSWHKPGDSE